MTEKRKIVEGEDRWFVIEDKYSRNSAVEVGERMKMMPNFRAQIATDMLVRWGSVAAMPGEEDSAGRATLRLQSVEESVKRAVEMADMLVTEFENRGWFIQVPHPDVLTLDGKDE